MPESDELDSITEKQIQDYINKCYIETALENAETNLLEDDSQFEDGKGVTHWMPLPEPPKDEQKEDVISKVTREIMDKHHEIIDDWGKAYMAQIYQEKGSIKPGDFVLYQQEIVEHGNPLSKIPSFKGYKYWFSLKDDQ